VIKKHSQETNMKTFKTAHISGQPRRHSCLLAMAQSWPSKPVRLIVPFLADAAPDVMARLVADRLGTVWSQAKFVEYRPGAGGISGISGISGMPGFDDIPPASDTVKGYESLGWFSIYAPAGTPASVTPASVIEPINNDIHKVIPIPALVSRSAEQGVYPKPGTPKALGDFV
jgi:tripartite-type tricarboxylate transporter receptor subunit TctC